MLVFYAITLVLAVAFIPGRRIPGEERGHTELDAGSTDSGSIARQQMLDQLVAELLSSY